MKRALVIGILLSTLGGCAVVPGGYGYRGDRHYDRDGYYPSERYDRGYRNYDYDRRYYDREHGQ